MLCSALASPNFALHGTVFVHGVATQAFSSFSLVVSLAGGRRFGFLRGPDLSI